MSIGALAYRLGLEGDRTTRRAAVPVASQPMRKVLIGVAIFLVAGLVVDVVALGVASKNLRQQISANVPHTGATHGRVRSFPFIGRFIVFGTISEVEASVDGVDAGPVHFENITAKLHGIKIDRGALVHRKARLQNISSGTVSAEISDTELSRLIGQTIKFTPGKASLTIHGFTINAKIEVQNGALKFGGLGLPGGLGGGLGGGLNIPGGLSIPGLSLPIPRAPLLPCSTQSADVIQGRIRVSCTITQIPKELFKTDLLSLGG
jgi:hypothetical protein